MPRQISRREYELNGVTPPPDTIDDASKVSVAMTHPFQPTEPKGEGPKMPAIDAGKTYTSFQVSQYFLQGYSAGLSANAEKLKEFREWLTEEDNEDTSHLFHGTSVIFDKLDSLFGGGE